MMYDTGHGDVPLADWQQFLKAFSPFVIDKVIDRSKTKLPDWFVPLARGVAIASNSLLCKARHIPGMYGPHGWRQSDCDVFELDVGPNGFVDSTRLYVRGCGHLWSIERLSAVRPYEHSGEVLVFLFGSTPICTRGCWSAMRLAMQCHANGPPAGLRWIAACPGNYEVIVKLAQKRRMIEALGR